MQGNTAIMCSADMKEGFFPVEMATVDNNSGRQVKSQEGSVHAEPCV